MKTFFATMDLQEALSHIKKSGQKLTPQRSEILRLLINQKGPVSAARIHDKVRLKHPTVSLDTVYRNLSMLVKTGLVTQLNLQSKDSARFEFQGTAHHHHAVCLECGKVLCINFCPRPEDLSVEDTGFKVTGHAFEVYGYCSSCKKQASVAN